MPPSSVMNQLRVAQGYAAAEVDAPDTGSSMADSSLHIRIVVPIGTADHFSPALGSSTLGVNSDTRWLQVIQPVPESIARNADQVQQGFRDYQELALSRLGLRKLYGITLTQIGRAHV